MEDSNPAHAVEASAFWAVWALSMTPGMASSKTSLPGWVQRRLAAAWRATTFSDWLLTLINRPNKTAG
jgi:hypothetical protein